MNVEYNPLTLGRCTISGEVWADRPDNLSEDGAMAQALELVDPFLHKDRVHLRDVQLVLDDDDRELTSARRRLDTSSCHSASQSTRDKPRRPRYCTEDADGHFLTRPIKP